jgi:hypothetical protein
MAWKNTWTSVREWFRSHNKDGVRLIACQRRDNDEEAATVMVDEGRIETIEKLSVAGAAATAVVGTTGILPQPYTHEISAGNTISFQPLQHGVSVIVATAAGESVAAVGKVCTFTDRNDDASTVTTMRATLAASNAAGLVRIDLGTAVVGDTWDHLLTLPEEELWALGTLPATCLTAWDTVLGRFAPVEMDATGGIKNSPSSLSYGEGDTVPQLRVQHARQFGVALAATGTGVATPCRLWGLSVTGFAGAGTATIRDGGAGGTVRYAQPIAADGIIELGEGTFGTDVHVTYGAGLAGTITPLYSPTT